MDTSLYMIHPADEPMIEVDWDTREVTVPGELVNIAVTNENNAETLMLKVADTFDGTSLSDKKASIRFQNAKKEIFKYEITHIESTDSGFLILEWNIDERLTRWAGEVLFEVHFDGDFYNLHSLPAKLHVMTRLPLLAETDIPLFESTVDQFISQLSDIESHIANIYQRLNTLEMNLASNIGQIETNQSSIGQLKGELEYVKNNMVFLNTYTMNL